MIPLVLKPKYWGLLNRWRKASRSKNDLRQDLLMALFCIGLIILLFVGTLDVLKHLQLLSNMAYLSAAQPLALFLLPLMAMLFLSGLVISIGTLFMSKDLDLLLAAPLSTTSLFMGKFLYVLLSTAWMPFLFMTPVLIAFGLSYKVSLLYYFLSPLLLLPYFIIPTALAVIISTIFVLLVPANRTKEVLLITVIIILGALASLVDLLDLSPTSFDSASQMLRMISILSLPDNNWLPSNWLARCLQELLEPGTQDILPPLLLLFFSAGALSALAYLVLEILHAKAHSCSSSIKQRFRSTPFSQGILSHLCAAQFEQRMVALLGKELKICVRDIAQTLQIVVLVGLCIIYLYNLKIFGNVQDLPLHMRSTWQSFLLIGNLMMESFVVTAICTRFVYPSISLEGAAFWLLSSSPLSIREFMELKFWFWFIPVAALAGIFLAIGNYMVGTGFYILLISFATALAICYGVVGLAIGLGAYWANFDWEHPSQLAASFGSLMFMLLSVALILMSILPVVMFVVVQHETTLEISRLPSALTGLALLIALNYLSARLALELGERKLIERMH
ncbi:MAG: hypothetical protein GX589_00670 [Deltaproteobacteria bacterium]|nr:hypothetical protein [Deltaproteobacteria bacterium]